MLPPRNDIPSVKGCTAVSIIVLFLGAVLSLVYYFVTSKDLASWSFFFSICIISILSFLIQLTQIKKSVQLKKPTYILLLTIFWTYAVFFLSVTGSIVLIGIFVTHPLTFQPEGDTIFNDIFKFCLFIVPITMLLLLLCSTLDILTKIEKQFTNPSTKTWIDYGISILFILITIKDVILSKHDEMTFLFLFCVPSFKFPTNVTFLTLDTDKYVFDLAYPILHIVLCFKAVVTLVAAFIPERFAQSGRHLFLFFVNLAAALFTVIVVVFLARIFIPIETSMAKRWIQDRREPERTKAYEEYNPWLTLHGLVVAGWVGTVHAAFAIYFAIHSCIVQFRAYRTFIAGVETGAHAFQAKGGRQTLDNDDTEHLLAGGDADEQGTEMHNDTSEQHDSSETFDEMLGSEPTETTLASGQHPPTTWNASSLA